MKGIEALEEIVRIQTSDGNWNCNEYMWGMANGLILALAVMKDEEPQYLKRPDVWLDNVVIETTQYCSTIGDTSETV